MKSLILIKLGGSLITDKSRRDTINKKNLNILCADIKKAQDLGYKLIIAHGQGSFAHIPAKKYNTFKGIVNKKSYRGICEVASKASQLNRIVTDCLFQKGVNAFSINPSSIIVSYNHNLKKIFIDSIEQLLKNNLTPVLYGDQIIDEKIGCTIFSAEKVLNNIALDLKRKKYKIKKIIHCTNVDGVLDAKKNIVEEINLKNFKNLKKNIKSSKNVDVTGGMLHKVEQSLEMAQSDIESYIINGSIRGNLMDVIKGKKFVGTRITK
jgi:isopentenyl phosphate kinase